MKKQIWTLLFLLAIGLWMSRAGADTNDASDNKMVNLNAGQIVTQVVAHMTDTQTPWPVVFKATPQVQSVGESYVTTVVVTQVATVLITPPPFIPDSMSESVSVVKAGTGGVSLVTYGYIVGALAQGGITSPLRATGDTGNINALFTANVAAAATSQLIGAYSLTSPFPSYVEWSNNTANANITIWFYKH